MDWTGTIDRFRALAALEFVTFKPQQIFCVKVYVDLEQIWVRVLMHLQLTECYVILINCFWNYEDWTDRLAKIFDSCALGKNTDISMFEYKQDPNPVYFYGADDSQGITGLSTYCNPGYN